MRYPPSVSVPQNEVNYGWRKCPTCNGTGINPVLPINLCPKCKGEKQVPVHR